MSRTAIFKHVNWKFDYNLELLAYENVSLFRTLNINKHSWAAKYLLNPCLLNYILCSLVTTNIVFSITS